MMKNVDTHPARPAYYGEIPAPNRNRIMLKCRLQLVVVSSITIMLILALTGCYRHVIRVDDMSSDRYLDKYKIYEPNLRLEGDKKGTFKKMAPTRIVKPK